LTSLIIEAFQQREGGAGTKPRTIVDFQKGAASFSHLGTSFSLSLSLSFSLSFSFLLPHPI
jgi:hypothetical protein